MNKKLLKELRAIGAPDHEIEVLGKTAERLEAVHVPGLSRAARQRIADRLPVDIDAKEPRHRISPRLFLAVAGSFAVLAIAVVGFSQTLLPSTAPEHGEKARATEQTKADDMLEKQAAEIQELKQQEVIDEQAVQKAQDEFQRSYEKYEQRATQEQDFKNRWQNYRQEWWWGNQQSAPLPSSDRQTDTHDFWR